MASSVLMLSACNKGPEIADDPKTPEAGCYTFMDYTTVSPSNWNELTYQDANDTQIMGQIGGSFFTFNYEFDAKGKIVKNGYSVEYDGATKLEDISGEMYEIVDAGDIFGPEYAGMPYPVGLYNVPALLDRDGDGVEESLIQNGDGYAYRITLREDLKWDDGTPIKAQDFVYSMKEQLNPLFLNYRADSFYAGETVIANAQNYVKQGQEGMFSGANVYTLADYTEALDEKLIFQSYTDSSNIEDLKENSYILNWFVTGNPSYSKYFKMKMENSAGEEVDGYGVFLIPYLYGAPGVELADVAKMSKALDGKSLKEIKADATLKGYWDLIIGWWQTDPGEEITLCVTHSTYPEMDFEEVGIYAESDYELVVVLDNPLELLKDDGSLSYKAAYNFASLPLVKEDLYEANKVAPTQEGALWTSTYNSSVESTASWGPYKLTSFQAGKQYILERNEYWYGYNMDEYDGQYQTDRIVCNTIAEWQTAWLSFQQGNITSIGIDISIANDYKNSSRAIFTPGSGIFSMQLQSSKDGLKERETAGVDKEMLLYDDFRKALALSIDRSDYNTTLYTAHKANYGLYGPVHFYDVENNGIYRETDQAKLVLCHVYGVDPEDFDSLDAAVASITGKDLDQARELLNSAYDQALAAGTISATDKVVLTLGASEDTESVRREYEYLKAMVEELAKGTKLDGRLTLDLDCSFGTKWADDFRAGAYDICTGGWSGAAWNPFYLISAYIEDNSRYAAGWDPTTCNVTLNPYGDGDESHTYTENLVWWYNALNGVDNPTIDFSQADPEIRLNILAAMEEAILLTYYVVPTTAQYGASLLSKKVEYISYDYNTFMGFGGIRYIRYNYDDLAWAYVKTLFDYKN